MKPMQASSHSEITQQRDVTNVATTNALLSMKDPRLWSRIFKFIPVLFVLLAAMSARTYASPWTGSGPGTTAVLSDGSTRHPQFQYFLSGGTHSDQTWDFHTTADADGAVTLPYCWTGFNAFFQVPAHLQA